MEIRFWRTNRLLSRPLSTILKFESAILQVSQLGLEVVPSFLCPRVVVDTYMFMYTIRNKGQTKNNIKYRGFMPDGPFLNSLMQLGQLRAATRRRRQIAKGGSQFGRKIHFYGIAI